MPRLDDLRLSVKLLLPVAVALVGFGAILAAATSLGERNALALQAVEQRYVPGLLLARDMGEALEAYQRALRAAADATDADLLAQSDEKRAVLLAALPAARAAGVATAEETRALQAALDAYVLVARPVIEQLVAGRTDADLAGFAARYRSLSEAIEAFRATNAHRMEESFAVARESQSGSLRTIVLVIVVAIAVLVWVSFLMARRLSERVGRLTAAAERVASGELSTDVDLPGADELALLGRSFSKMLSRISRHQDELRGAVEELRALSARLAALSRQQEEGATREASSVQETSVTLEQLRHASQAASDRAVRVREVAERARDMGEFGTARAEAGRHAMEEIRTHVGGMVDAIGAAAGGARELRGIVAGVRELAEQSNMVALNAAIETAQQGMSTMRPVAQEMRHLADQSADETRRVSDRLVAHENTLELASERSTRGLAVVTEGLSDLDQTATVLRDILGIVNESSTAAVEISTGVRQQHAAIAQIAVAMSDLRSGVEATVAGVGELRRTAADLELRSGRLEALVSEFRR